MLDMAVKQFIPAIVKYIEHLAHTTAEVSAAALTHPSKRSFSRKSPVI
jgi:glutamine synthetase type III